MKTRRGSVRPHGNGFQARVTIAGVAYNRSFPTEAEAYDYLDAVGEIVDAEATAEATLLTVGAKWFKDRETSGVFRHVPKELAIWNAHVLPWKDAARPIASIKRKHVATFIDSMCAKKKRDGETRSRQSVKHVLRLVKKCLDYAADKGLVQTNAAEGVRVARREGGAESWTWLVPAEIDAVLGCAQPTGLDLERRSIYAAAIYSGLRKSELWALRWEHVALDGASPHLRVLKGKSNTSRRLVPLLPPVASLLREWRERGGVHRLTGIVWPSDSGGQLGEDNDAGWRDHPYVITVDGKPVRKVRLGTRSRAGIDRPCRFHDLRHTCASHLVQGTWTGAPLSLHEVKEWLGHSSIAVTQRYAHLRPDGLLRYSELATDLATGLKGDSPRARIPRKT